ncbi:phosphoenolpyruvate carboxykinase (ATP) [Aurantiacibacter spongiae]|uniref:HprK-related kinase A n=1 Tax=Aurantiacibacter spongiae TaxID=2488860 RepID=A0A3N5DIP9_9SPHN|nr:hypothetical protein [Aurantiacibacter spongiae]RPF71532.1 hypothetical protein EG799_07815 [Aurantiacibacter spongiae]
MTRLEKHPAREQVALAREPYDRWITPAGDTLAEFHRENGGYLVRFRGQADFHIDAGTQVAICVPVPGLSASVVDTLYRNSVLPMLGNHGNGLNLHGSAVAIGDVAVAFTGLSRRGKTTLAGAMARTGHPLVSEDVLALERRGDDFWVQPMRPSLRVFGDSARYLFGERETNSAVGEKADYAFAAEIPFADRSLPLAAIHILGPGTAPTVSIEPVGEAAALAEMLNHAFILDVEDRQRLQAHFDRMADLARMVPCLALDYPRQFDHLPEVIATLVARYR